MIARTLPRPQPIPFADRLRGTLPATPAVRWTPPPPPAVVVRPLNEPRPAPRPLHTPVDAELPARQARARYDGAHALSVRSSATGRLYRFTHPGAIESIDAADIALMRRIDSVTVL